MKKTAVIALMMTVGLLCSSGCTQKNKNSDVANFASSPDTVSVLQTASSANKVGVDSAQHVAETFIKALHDKDYKSVLSLLNISGDNNFVTADGLERSINTSDIQSKARGVANLDMDNFDILRDQTSPDTVTFMFSDKKTPDFHYSVDAVFDPVHNEWKISSSDLYTEQFSFTAPSSVDIYVDGNKVSSNLADVENLGESGMLCRYTLPYVNKTAKIRLDYGSFDYETTITTESDNAFTGSVPAVYKAIDKGKHQGYCDAVKDNWNGLSKAMSKSESDTDIYKYVSKEASDETVDDITTTILHDNKLNHDFKITKLDYADDDSYYLADDTVYISFKYMLEWYDSEGYAFCMRRMSNVVMKKESDKWLFLQDSDVKLFSYFMAGLKEC